MNDPSPAPRFVPAIVHEGPPAPDSLLFVARGLDVVVRREGERMVVPALEAVASLGDGPPHFLGTLDGKACFAVGVRRDLTVEAPYELVPARNLYGVADEALLAVAGRAIAIAEWDVTHRFCGKCGAKTELDPKERSRRCPGCHTPFYPRVTPAIIVLIERGDTALLAHAPTFRDGMFSTLAGFVEPGESFEEAVCREVKEEVGIEVHRLRYFGSQPWPFGRSLMVGFFAEHKSGEIAVDGVEIAEARWFRRDALPMIPPKLSIARRLIDDWRARGS